MTIDRNESISKRTKRNSILQIKRREVKSKRRWDFLNIKKKICNKFRNISDDIYFRSYFVYPDIKRN